MSDEKVITLPGGFRVQPIPAIVKMCEQMLEKAKTGELQAMAGVVFDIQAGPATFKIITDMVTPVVIVGAIAQCQYELMRDIAQLTQPQNIIPTDDSAQKH